jgi:hypothetical protein
LYNEAEGSCWADLEGECGSDAQYQTVKTPATVDFIDQCKAYIPSSPPGPYERCFTANSCDINVENGELTFNTLVCFTNLFNYNALTGCLDELDTVSGLLGLLLDPMNAMFSGFLDQIKEFSPFEIRSFRVSLMIDFNWDPLLLDPLSPLYLQYQNAFTEFLADCYGSWSTFVGGRISFEDSVPSGSVNVIFDIDFNFDASAWRASWQRDTFRFAWRFFFYTRSRLSFSFGGLNISPLGGPRLFWGGGWRTGTTVCELLDCGIGGLCDEDNNVCQCEDNYEGVQCDFQLEGVWMNFDFDGLAWDAGYQDPTSTLYQALVKQFYGLFFGGKIFDVGFDSAETYSYTRFKFSQISGGVRVRVGLYFKYSLVRFRFSLFQCQMMYGSGLGDFMFGSGKWDLSPYGFGGSYSGLSNYKIATSEDDEGLSYTAGDKCSAIQCVAGQGTCDPDLQECVCEDGFQGAQCQYYSDERCSAEATACSTYCTPYCDFDAESYTLMALSFHCQRVLEVDLQCINNLQPKCTPGSTYWFALYEQIDKQKTACESLLCSMSLENCFDGVILDTDEMDGTFTPEALSSMAENYDEIIACSEQLPITWNLFSDVCGEYSVNADFQNILLKMKASLKDGKYQFTFGLPTNIDFPTGDIDIQQNLCTLGETHEPILQSCTKNAEFYIAAVYSS